MARRLLKAPGGLCGVLPRVALALSLPLISGFPVHAVAATSEISTADPAAPAPRVASCNTPGDAHALKGTVTDPTGAAISSANVTFLCGDQQKSVVTSASGTFSLNLLPGNYQVQIVAPGFTQLSRAVTLAAGDTYVPANFGLALGTAQNTVTVSANGGFVGEDTATGTKTDTALVEVPQSISIITGAELSTRNVQSLDQALDYTPGVSPAIYGQDPRFDWITIRGFEAQSYGLFRDGLRWQSSDTTGRIEPFDLEQIDILKGPASVLYGQSEPGGVINLVSKRPLAQPLHDLEFDAGSYNRRQGRLDFSGPLDPGGKLLYRIVGLDRNSGTQVDFLPDNRRYVAPSLTWVIGKQTALTFLGEWQYDHTNWGQFLPAYGTLLANPNGIIPINRYLGEPSDYYKRQQWDAGYLFEHHFSDIWTLRQNFRYSNVSNSGNDHYGYGFGPDSFSVLQRFGAGYFLASHVYAVDTQLQAAFNHANLSNTILLGEDYSAAYESILSTSGPGGSINVFHPVYGQAADNFAPYSLTRSPSAQNGIYLQDQVKLRQHLIFTLGGREDWAVFRTRNLYTPGSFARQHDSKFTGRAGVTWLTNSGFAPYFSYSTSFVPTTGTNLLGVAFKPTTGTQYEVGAKYQPHGWRGFLTGSFYNVAENNVQTADPTNPLNTVQTGAVRSRGVELEGVADLYSSLKLHAGYDYDDLVVTKANDDTLGHRPILVPEQTASLLLDYTIPQSTLKGVNFGGGVRYIGISAGAPDGTLPVPGYTLFDANAGYTFHSVRFSVNATNVADKRYVALCDTTAYCNYGASRNVIGSASWNLPSFGHKSE
jgi:iron complex outermembrane receptor protein